MHLLCVQASQVHSAISELGTDDSDPAKIAGALWRISADWPSDDLTVQIEAADSTSHSWLPQQLVSRTCRASTRSSCHYCNMKALRRIQGSTHLDITPYVRRGKNVLCLAALESMSDRLFAIHAASPQEQERRGAAYLSRWLPRSPPASSP